MPISTIIESLAMMYYLSERVEDIQNESIDSLVNKGLIQPGSKLATNFEYFKSLMNLVNESVNSYPLTLLPKGK